MAMFNPPHPGDGLREDVLPALVLTITSLSERLGYSEDHLSAVLNCRAALSADLAKRLETTGLGSARTYVAEQAAYDLWQAQHR